MTLMRRDGVNSGDSKTSQLAVHKKNDFLTKCFSEYASSQQLKILKIRLQFLRDCKLCRRPPPSLRINGASALDESDKLFNFSVLESKNLEAAIKVKINEIRQLKLEIDSRNLHIIPLADKDEKNLRKHYSDKLNFYRQQDKTKWKSWPIKSDNILKKVKEQGRTTRN